MFANRENQRVPEGQFHVITEQGGLQAVSSAEVFEGRTVVVFALPGAFTPTCSSAHVPRYEELAKPLAAAGVDEIVCVSVNDAFVMDAWGRDQGVNAVRLLADGNGDWTKAMGLLVDKRSLGFGQRSWRYAMLVRDGVIERQFIEADVPGDPYEVSDADTMLTYLDPSHATHGHDIVLFTKQGCGHCRRAKAMLAEAGLDYADVPATPGMLRAVSAVEQTTPRVFVDGTLIGGADELGAWLANKA
jgi:peroxiredoxin/glutaredoxin